MLIDTHSHIYEPEFDADRAEVAARAAKAGVGLMLLPAIDVQSDARMFATCREYPETTVPMMGLHPTLVNDNAEWGSELDRVESYLAQPPQGIVRFCGVGEIGLDFYWSSDFAAEQTEAFASQIELAIKYDLPIEVHTRNAWSQMRDIVRSFRGRGLRGVFHAFSENTECYRELLKYGDFMFGIGGVVTFKKSAVADTVREMSLDDIVLETDCPYLTPVPNRGKRNEPAYLGFIRDKVADLQGVTPDEVAARTTANARKMFGL